MGRSKIEFLINRWEDLRGQIFGYLKPLDIFTGIKYPKLTWKCRCKCGKLTYVAASSLKSGNTKSCGCYQKECIKQLMYKHGRSRKTEYNIWKDFIARCSNKNNPNYARYGGRGIKVCKRWLTFTNFFEDMGKRPSIVYSLDRKDNNKGYYKDNCRWTTKKVQANNTRRTIFITYKNKSRCLSAWSKSKGFKLNTLYQRLFVYKWDVKKALESPLRCQESN